jgi:hypothetical protein
MNDMSAIERAALEKGHCVDCGHRGFVLGPRGGVAINIECANVECRSRYNVTTFAGEVLSAQRIERTGKWPSEPSRQGDA